MHILFLDESGTPPGPTKCRDKYFVIGGLVIPDGVWRKVHDALHGMKVRRHLVGEVKWRYFAASNTDPANPMREMTQGQRNEIRTEMYQIICSVKAIKTMACVACIESAYEMPSVTCSDDLYHYTYKPLSERFQYHLQDLSRTVGRTEMGIIVADHRGAKADAHFRRAHERLVRPDTEFTANYQNLVESLFFQPSDISVGVQLADLVAGAVWRKFEKGDDFCYRQLEPSLRRSPTGIVDGHGIVKFPKGTWR
jgi:hypothetical protein